MAPLVPPKLPSLPALDFKGQTILVTGTTNGLGLAVSEELLRLRVDRLIMGVRDVKAGEALKARLLADKTISINPETIIDVVELSMDKFSSVVGFANKVKQLTQLLDIALLNAGTGGVEHSLTTDGHEKIIQVNLLSTAILSLELLPLLQSGAAARKTPTRLTVVGSFTQDQETLTKKALGSDESVIGHFDKKENFDGGSRYPNTKLLTTMFTKELGTKVDKSKVIVNEVSPGPVWTNFGAVYPWYMRAVFKTLSKIAARPMSEAMKTYLYAIAVAGPESHGEYLSDNKIAPRATIVGTPAGKAIQQKLWDEIMDIARKADPSVATL